MQAMPILPLTALPHPCRPPWRRRRETPWPGRSPTFWSRGRQGRGRRPHALCWPTLAAGLNYINVGDLVKSKSLHDGWDDELECFILNDDLLIDEMEDMVKGGGTIVDYHSCDIFPERWFDAVVVLQTDHAVLYERLTNRGYTSPKLQNNMECEIFQILLEEARDSYRPELVRALPSNTIEDMSSNVEILGNWVKAWTPPATASS